MHVTDRIERLRDVPFPQHREAGKPVVHSVGESIVVSRAGLERYARIESVTDDEVTIVHRGCESSFDRRTGACIESDGGAMFGFVLTAVAHSNAAVGS